MSFLVGGPPGEGVFGFQEDYVKLGNVLAGFLQRIVLHHLPKEDFLAYRLYLNLQSLYLRGFPDPSHMDLFHPVPDAQGDLETSDSLAAKFLFQHGLNKVTEMDSAGWYPLNYAALRGDANVVRSLLEEMADPDARTQKHQALFGLQKDLPPMGIAIYFGNNAVVKLLVEARANLGLTPPPHLAAMANNVEGIRIICQACDRPWEKLYYGMTAAQAVAWTSSMEAVRELLAQSKYTMDLSGTLVAGMVFRGTAELVDELVQAKADVNDTQNSLAMIWPFHNLRYLCGARTPAARVGHMSFGATPLMFAIAAGQYEGAAALIVARANLEAVNFRKQTALDLAREFGTPQFLLDALENNNPTACRRMVTSALTNRFFVHEKF